MCAPQPGLTVLLCVSAEPHTAETNDVWRNVGALVECERCETLGHETYPWHQRVT